MGKIKTHEIFLKEVFNLVGNEYEVQEKYINTETKINLKHTICGKIYNVKPNSFLKKGNRCPYCSLLARAKKRTKGHLQFIKELHSLVGDEYIAKEKYKGVRVKILIKHEICGNEYYVTPNHLLYDKSKCPKCKGGIAYSHEDFIKKVYEKEGNNYIALNKYVKSNTKILMKHNTSQCGNEFYMSPSCFLRGQRCPKCKESKGEKIIYNFLKNKNINFYQQYRFENCKYKNTLSFDFAVVTNEEILFLIEYDGEFHYQASRYIKNREKSEKKLKECQIRDKIKDEYCKAKNIKLLRIPYWNFKNIEHILNKWLIEYNISEVSLI